MTIREVQLGKNGITNNFIEALKINFKKIRTIKISVLKSAREKKADIKNYSEELLKKFGRNYTSRIVGFTIILKKWRKPQREQSPEKNFQKFD